MPTLANAHSPGKHPPHSSIHIGAARFMLVEKLGIYRPFPHPCYRKVPQKPIQSTQVPPIVASPVTLSFRISFVPPRHAPRFTLSFYSRIITGGSSGVHFPISGPCLFPESLDSRSVFRDQTYMTSERQRNCLSQPKRYEAS